MSCTRTLEVEAARDGRDPRSIGLDTHVRGCAVCRARLAELDELALALRALPVAPSDELAARRRRGELLTRHVNEAHPRRRLTWFATAAALGIVGAVAYVVTRAPVIFDVVEIRADGATWSRLDAGNTSIVRLDDGEAELRVTHHDRRLVVIVPDGELDDVGTTFRVTVRDHHTTRIAVDEGAILFHQIDHPAVALVRGDRWTAHVAVVPPPTIAASPPAPVVVTPAPRAARPDPLGAAIARLDAADPAGAATALRRFLVEHPHDARGEDAEFLLIIALQRVPDPDGVRAAAGDYLRDYPSGLRRSSVEPLAR
jgi:hypothetical protein